MVMGADYSFELISIETYAAQFIGHNKFFLGSVSSGLIPLEFQHNSGIHQGLDDVDLCPAATSNRV